MTGVVPSRANVCVRAIESKLTQRKGHAFQGGQSGKLLPAQALRCSMEHQPVQSFREVLSDSETDSKNIAYILFLERKTCIVR